MKKIKVIKRDDSVEDFSEDKLLRVAIATGLSEEKAEQMIANIKNWAEKKGKVKSTDIKELFSKELREIRPYSADLYDWYQKVKIKNSKHNYNFKTS